MSGWEHRPGAVELARLGPGAGKTALLVQTAREALQGGLSPTRVLCLCLDTEAAKVLQDRFLSAGEADGCYLLPTLLTYERLAEQMLAEALPELGDRRLAPLTERLLLGRVLGQLDEEAAFYREPVLRHSAQFRDDVADFIAELKQNKISPERFTQLAAQISPARGPLTDLASIYARYQELLRGHGVFDLRGILWLALQAWEDSGRAQEHPGNSRFDLLLADDLQDATALQLELLAAVAGPGTQVLGVYEPEQALYRFRGALLDPRPLLVKLLGNRVAPEKAEPPAPSLNQAAYSFRAAFSTTPRRLPEGAPPAVSLYQTREAELLGLAESIRDLLENGEIAAEGIGVITRVQQDAADIRSQLRLLGVPLRGDEPEGAWLARQVAGDCLELLAHYRYPQPPLNQRARQAEISHTLCQLAKLIASPQEQFALQAVAEQDGDLLRSNASGSQLVERLRLLMQEAEGQGLAAALGSLTLGLLRLLPVSQRDTVQGPLGVLLAQVMRAEQWHQELLGTGLEPAELQTVLQETVLHTPLTASGVSVLTAHQSRGRRFRHLFLPCLREDTFPSPGRVSRLLERETVEQLRKLADAPPGSLPFSDFAEVREESQEEEQRLFYNCLTRTTERLSLSCSLGAGQTELAPSPFLIAAMGGLLTLAPAAERPSGFSCLLAGSAPEAAAGRASHAGCPICPCPRGESFQPHRSEAAAPAAAPPATGPVLEGAAAGLVLYPSHLEQYLFCPRRYFLVHLVGVAAEEEADNLTYGSMIHEFFQRFNQQPLALRGQEHSEAILRGVFAGCRDRFSSPVAADLYLRRALTPLPSFLESSSATSPAILQEQTLQFSLQGEADERHCFAGRIDVVLGNNEGLRLVDYKTGKVERGPRLAQQIPQTEDDVYEGKREVQLPLYALAWEQQKGAQPLTAVCLHGYNREQAGAPSCWILDGQDAEATWHSVRIAFQALLVQWAQAIKAAPEFCGEAPEEGCLQWGGGGCPFVGICDEAELS